MGMRVVGTRRDEAVKLKRVGPGLFGAPWGAGTMGEPSASVVKKDKERIKKMTVISILRMRLGWYMVAVCDERGNDVGMEVENGSSFG